MTSDHDVQLYDDASRLVESVGGFFAAGVEAGENALALATPEHCEAFRAALEARGLDTRELEAEGRLVLADAEQALAAVLDGEILSPDRFEREATALLDRAAGTEPRRVRVFGELVDLLWQRGERATAVTLEDSWNRLLARRDFSLLCGYRVADPFDREVHVDLVPALCRTHAHVHPAGDPERLRVAVDAALADSLGPGDAGRVYVLSGAGRRLDRVPASQLALMWVSAHMPRAAERVLATARERYASV